MDNRDQPSSSQYAVAKIAGIKMCQAYRRRYGFNAICAMLTNFYGSGDNFDLETSHVLPAALIRKFHEAKESGAPAVAVRGTGTARREFLHVDDLADACRFLVRKLEKCRRTERDRFRERIGAVGMLDPGAHQGSSGSDASIRK